MTEGKTVVDVRSICKTFRQRSVLNNVTLQVTCGEFVGIYGPNGSGKSLLLRVISGLVLPDSGEVRVFGKRLAGKNEFPPDLGALIDGPGFLLDRSGLYNLQLLASIRNEIPQKRIDDALKMVGLNPDDKRPVKTYSTGMRQRLGIAQAIMEYPKLLLLDEPTSSLDPDGSEQIVTLLKKMRTEGVTTIIVSHKDYELTTMCDSIYRMYEGQLTSAASP